MTELVEYIAEFLVSEPDEIVVTEVPRDDYNIDIEIVVANKDIGRVIGRRGRVAQNIRTILRAISLRKGKNYNLKIVEND